jgi:hypothetical protein
MICRTPSETAPAAVRGFYRYCRDMRRLMQGMGNNGDRVAVLHFYHYSFDVSMTVIGFIKPAISATQPFCRSG